MIQVQYLLSCLLRMCETWFHYLEAAFAYLKTAVRLSPNSRLQVKLCIFFQRFPVGCFFLFFSFFCALESLWFIKMGCDGSLESGYGISDKCYHCVWYERVDAILGGISSYSQTHTPPVQFAYFRRLWHSEAHDFLQPSDPLLLSSQQFAIIANYTQVCILALIVIDFISFL